MSVWMDEEVLYFKGAFCGYVLSNNAVLLDIS